MAKLRRDRTQRLPKGRLVLQERDVGVLKALSEYRVLTSSQLTDLFFTQKSFADRRLRKLYDQKILDRILQPVVTGSAEILCAIGPVGASYLGSHVGLSRSQTDGRRRLARASSGYLEHRLDLNRFRLAVTLAVRHGTGYSLARWQEGFPVGHLRPDAFFALDTPKGRAFFFLEIDRATETTKRFQSKLRLYHQY